MGSGEKYDMNKAVALFFTESREMLVNMEACLLALEKDPGDAESINSLFRAVHTIKGSSGMFSFSGIEKFTHVAENVLDAVRTGALAIDGGLIETLLECHDYIRALLDAYEDDPQATLDDARVDEGAELLARLTARAAGTPVEAVRLDPSDFRVESGFWHISLRFGESVFQNGLDPQSFIAYLGEMGRIVNIAVIDDRLPALEELDPERCHLGFEIVFDGAADKNEILEVFEFVKDDCDIRILPPRSAIDEYVRLIRELPETPLRVGDILRRVGSLTERELESALALQQDRPGQGPATEGQSLLGEIMVDEKMVHQPVLEAALEKQKDMQKAEERKSRSIRIDADKLDELINIVGELVITGANVRQLLEKHHDTAVLQAVTTMSRLIEDVRDRIMNVRMVQIGETFRRFERMVRDLSRETGKEIDLSISGGDTELDKTLVEKISDPLMHIIRNSIDHGIGMPDERVRAGKPRRGTIAINAFHETGSVVIEIRDDGSGLNRDRIRAKAVERGLIAPGQPITDEDLFPLVFEPGFSTAEAVTSISGRGVGMDVVKRNIESLRGTVVLESEAGVGMIVRVHLPLTLAIIDGFMVAVGDSYYIVPLDVVREVFEVSREELDANEGANIINLRGGVLPYMRLRDFFGERGEDPETECVVVVEYARRTAGIVVDRPIGEFQTVIKSLGRLFRDATWASGATILGSGEVALVLDVPRLIQSNHMHEAALRQA